jgi:hypothetical protein
MYILVHRFNFEKSGQLRFINCHHILQDAHFFMRYLHKSFLKKKRTFYIIILRLVLLGKALNTEMIKVLKISKNGSSFK